MATNTEELREQLEPYRGKKGLLYKDLGAMGMAALAQLCNYSPMEAAEFLGNGRSYRSQISRQWAMLGIPVKRRDWAKTATDNSPLAELEGGQQEQTLSPIEVIRRRYQADTSTPQLARVVDWPIPKTADFAHLICIGDLHYGPKNMDYARWLRLRDWIAENHHVRWVGLGDFLDTAVHDSPGMGGEGQCLKFDEAMELLEDDLRPIRKQCLQMCSGNHEGRVAAKLKLNFSPLKEIAKRLDIHYRDVGTSRYLRIDVRKGNERQEYAAFLHHGFGGGRTVGGKVATLFQTIAWNDIDLLAMGHTHLLLVVEQIRKYLGSDIIEKDGQRYVQVKTRRIPLGFCGSFLEHEDDTYPQDMGLPPASLGSADFRLYTDNKTVHGRV